MPKRTKLRATSRPSRTPKPPTIPHDPAERPTTMRAMVRISPGRKLEVESKLVAASRMVTRLQAQLRLLAQELRDAEAERDHLSQVAESGEEESDVPVVYGVRGSEFVAIRSDHPDRWPPGDPTLARRPATPEDRTGTLPFDKCASTEPNTKMRCQLAAGHASFHLADGASWPQATGSDTPPRRYCTTQTCVAIGVAVHDATCRTCGKPNAHDRYGLLEQEEADGVETPDLPSPEKPYALGDRLVHPIFGEATIYHDDGDGEGDEPRWCMHRGEDDFGLWQSTADLDREWRRVETPDLPSPDKPVYAIGLELLHATLGRAGIDLVRPDEPRWHLFAVETTPGCEEQISGWHTTADLDREWRGVDALRQTFSRPMRCGECGYACEALVESGAPLVCLQCGKAEVWPAAPSEGVTRQGTILSVEADGSAMVEFPGEEPARKNQGSDEKSGGEHEPPLAVKKNPQADVDFSELVQGAAEAHGAARRLIDQRDTVDTDTRRPGKRGFVPRVDSMAEAAAADAMADIEREQARKSRQRAEDPEPVRDRVCRSKKCALSGAETALAECIACGRPTSPKGGGKAQEGGKASSEHQKAVRAKLAEGRAAKRRRVCSKASCGHQGRPTNAAACRYCGQATEELAGGIERAERRGKGGAK